MIFAPTDLQRLDAVGATDAAQVTPDVFFDLRAQLAIAVLSGENDMEAQEVKVFAIHAQILLITQMSKSSVGQAISTPMRTPRRIIASGVMVLRN